MVQSISAINTSFKNTTGTLEESQNTHIPKTVSLDYLKKESCAFAVVNRQYHHVFAFTAPPACTN